MPLYEYVGNLHIHTRYSDGSGSVSQVLRAGRRAGLDFLVITDHRTLAARPAQGWHGNLLLLVGEELGEVTGHYLGLGIAEASQAVDPRAMIAAVTAQGGVGFIAHPHDPKFPWPDWSAPCFDGLSIWNFTSQWRWSMHAWHHWIVNTLWPGRVITAPPAETLTQWDALQGKEGTVPAVGCSDAHAFGWRPLGLPLVILPYTLLFRAINTHVLLEQPLTGEAAADEKSILRALRRGSAFIANGLRGNARGFRFWAEAGGRTWGMGGSAPAARGLRLKAALPRPGWMALLRDGAVVEVARGDCLCLADPPPGVYRLEVYRDADRRWGWIFGNPLRVGS